jgi:NAD-dependent SIR2 family protein deacetylase
MRNYETRLAKTKTLINNADFILIGGGAGLSDAAGIHYSGKRFTDNFEPFIKKYGFTDLYTSSFFPFKTQEERWAYWAKHISINRYDIPATKLYIDILQLVKDKNYFVKTTNVENQFVKAGFSNEKVFATQGDYSFFQCETACHNTLYYNEEQVREMIKTTHDCRIPSELIPKCPVCGGDMDINLRHNQYFVQDDNWHKANEYFTNFLNTCAGKPLVLLELGVGFNTAGIIRIPFEKLTYQNINSFLIRINRDHPQGVKENRERTITFTENMPCIIEALNRTAKKQALLAS